MTSVDGVWTLVDVIISNSIQIYLVSQTTLSHEVVITHIKTPFCDLF